MALKDHMARRVVLGAALGVIITIPLLGGALLRLLTVFSVPADASEFVSNMAAALEVLSGWPLWVKWVFAITAWTTYLLYLFGTDGIVKAWWFFSDKDKRYARMRFLGDNNELRQLYEAGAARHQLEAANWDPIEQLDPNAHHFEAVIAKREEVFRRIRSLLGSTELAHEVWHPIRELAETDPPHYGPGDFPFDSGEQCPEYNFSWAQVERANQLMIDIREHFRGRAMGFEPLSVQNESLQRWVRGVAQRLQQKKAE